MSKIKILHLIATNFVGGPEKQILNHVASIDTSSFEVQIGSFSEGRPSNPLLEEAKKRNLPVFQIESKSSFDPRQVFQLRKHLRSHRVQLLCTHGYKSNFIGFWATRTYRIPQIAFLRGWTKEDWKVRIYDRLDRFWIRFADLIVCVSEAKKKELLALRVPTQKIEVVYNAFGLKNLPSQRDHNIRQKLNIPESSKIIASFGRLSPEKGHKFLILAAASLVQKKVNVSVLIFGEGKEKRNLQRLIDSLKMGHRVYLAGFVTNPLDYMNQVDLVVNPSLTEGLPNVLLEALALKKPVVATAVGGTPEIIEDNQTGLLVPARDPLALADRISYALENTGPTRSMAEQGFSLLQSKFSLEAQTEQLQILYRRLVSV